ncbi:hypothetical protein MRX96_031556 [Rhipicephalus microplus]
MKRHGQGTALERPLREDTAGCGGALAPQKLSFRGCVTGGPWKGEARCHSAPSPQPGHGGAVMPAAPEQAPPSWPAVRRKRAGLPWRWAATVGQSASMGPEHQAASAQGFSVQRLLDQAPPAAQRARQPSTGERSHRASVGGCRLC